jgi:hypothetical protein
MAPQKRQRKRSKRGNRQVPYPEGQINLAAGPHIPPRNFLEDKLGGVQQSIRRTLVWVAGANQAVTSTFNDFQQVILNSPYDPDAALGGSSAAGFAKYMNFYTKCFCLGARIKFKFASASTGGGGTPTSAFLVGMTITTLTSPFSSSTNAIQNGLCDYIQLNQHPDSGMLCLGVDVAKYVDKPNLLDDPQFFCSATTNPSQQIVAHIWVVDTMAAGGTTLPYIIECEMDCVFTDPYGFT